MAHNDPQYQMTVYEDRERLDADMHMHVCYFYRLNEGRAFAKFISMLGMIAVFGKDGERGDVYVSGKKSAAA